LGPGSVCLAAAGQDAGTETVYPNRLPASVIKSGDFSYSADTTVVSQCTPGRGRRQAGGHARPGLRRLPSTAARGGRCPGHHSRAVGSVSARGAGAPAERFPPGHQINDSAPASINFTLPFGLRSSCRSGPVHGAGGTVGLNQRLPPNLYRRRYRPPEPGGTRHG
jgi:hypothetical protein